MIKHTEFRNFQPTHDLGAHVRSTFRALMGSVPYGASGGVRFRRLEVGYFCSLEVLSRGGRYVSRMLADSPKEAFDRACAQLRAQFRKSFASRNLRLAGPALS